MQRSHINLAAKHKDGVDLPHFGRGTKREGGLMAKIQVNLNRLDTLAAVRTINRL